MKGSILVTGCAGLIGSHFCRHMLAKGYLVAGIDNLSGGYRDFLPDHENFFFHELDLETDDLSEVFETDFDCVYHFAAYAAEGLSPFIRKFNYRNNVVSSMNVINWCIKKSVKVVFTSSMAVYGNQTSPFRESMRPEPIDSYGIAKYTVEMDLKSAADQFGLRYNIVRPHNVLGIYQNIWDRYRNVIGIFIRRILDNQPLLIYGDGKQTRAFSDVSFYMSPLESLLDSHDGEIFNIGAEQHYCIDEVADICMSISEEYGFAPSKTYVQERHEVMHAYCDHSKAVEFLRFEDRTEIKDLIRDMFEWSLKQPKREVKSMTYEVEEKIYDYWK